MTDPFPAQWRIAGVSVPGSRHAAAAQANQDAWLYRPVAGDAFVLAIADGAGSRPRSAVGSRLAVEAAFTSARAVLPPRPPGQGPDWVALAERWAGACREVFTQAVTAVAGALSTGDELSPDDFASTLLAVLAWPPWYCYITVGDCFAVAQRRPGGTHLVVPPAMGGSRGVTSFLTTPGLTTPGLTTPGLTTPGLTTPGIRSGVIDDPHLAGLVLCSDGLIEAALDVARDDDGAMCYLAPPEFAGFFEILAEAGRTAGDLAAGLASPEYAAASGDDMTMVLAVRR